MHSIKKMKILLLVISFGIVSSCRYFQDVKIDKPSWRSGRNGALYIDAKKFDQVTINLSKPVNSLIIHYGLTNQYMTNSTQIQYTAVKCSNLYKEDIRVGYTMRYRGNDESAEFTRVDVNGVQCQFPSISSSTTTTTASTSSPTTTTFTTTSTTATQQITTTETTSTSLSTTSKSTTTSTITTQPITTTETPSTSSFTTSKSTTTSTTTSATTSPTTAATWTSTSTTSTNSSTCQPKYDYKKALSFSLLFYEAQRSGKLPETNRIPWRRDSLINVGSTLYGVNLSGGYYDAGGYVKFNFPQAFTITMLSWGMIEFTEGYKFAGEYENGLEAIKWGTDYFIRCHAEPNKLWGQVGNGHSDNSYWGRADELDEKTRECYYLDTSKPGSELVAETAASLAASSILFKDVDIAYSSTLLSHARQLYTFANLHRGTYHESITDVQSFYQSYSGYNDELAWAASWLYLATTENQYRTNAESVSMQNPGEFSWDNKYQGVNVLLSKINGGNNLFTNNARSFCNNVRDHTARTPQGMVFIHQWGSAAHAANVAFLCLVHSKYDPTVDYTSFAREQIHLLLGDAGRSFVVGFGNNPPRYYHHAGSSCPNRPEPCNWNAYYSPDPNPQILYGALVGGPKNVDGTYTDVRTDYISNEVGIYYNAGYQSAIAGLLNEQKNGKCF